MNGMQQYNNSQQQRQQPQQQQQHERRSRLAMHGNNNFAFTVRDHNLDISLSQSKASYLSHRRDRQPAADTEYGSYKRIMPPMDASVTSPVTHNNNNNHHHQQRHRHSLFSTKEQRDTLSPDKEAFLLGRLSLDNRKELKTKQNNEIKNPPPAACNLPDVLPVSVKMSPPRPLSLQPINIDYTTVTDLDDPQETASPNNKDTSTTTAITPLSPMSFVFPLDKHASIASSNSTTSSSSSSSSASSSSSSSSKHESQTGKVITTPSQSPEPQKSFLHSSSSTSSSLVSSHHELSSLSPPPSYSEIENQMASSTLIMSKSVATATASSSSSSSPATPQVVEGLQLIQRTEVVLRVNACTTDAASQTDQPAREHLDSVTTAAIPRTPLPARRKLQEEIDCEQLSRDVANQLSPSDKLKGILVPAPEYKKPADYVSGLFKLEVTSSRSSQPTFRSHDPVVSATSNGTSTVSTSSDDLTSSARSSLLSSSYNEPSSPLSATSTYFTTSEPKAKFLTRYSRDMSQLNGVVQDTKDLNQKKEELMNRLDRKLQVLRSEQLVVNEESRINDALGEQVSNYVTRVARPQELAKFRLHVEEVGKITSLLLGLSGRLARAENALMDITADHIEKKILENKRDKLREQLDEAKKLKENIDKRSVNVSNILYKYLNAEEYGDYDHFINMKAKLIMDSREIADKIKLGEEQLTALRETLNVT